MKANIEVIELLTVLLIGGTAGWLGNIIYGGSGLGLFGDIILGLLGGWIGYWLLNHHGMSLGDDLLGFTLNSSVGAIIIPFLIRLILKKKAIPKKE